MWLTDSGRHAANLAADYAAYRIALRLNLLYQLYHACRCLRIRTANRITLGVSRGFLHLNVTHLLSPRLYSDAMLGKKLLAKRAANHSRSRFARRGSTAAAIIPYTILRLIRKISMTRPENVSHLLIIAAPLIRILYNKTDRSSGGHAVKHARQHSDSVSLLTTRSNVTLTRTTPV